MASKRQIEIGRQYEMDFSELAWDIASAYIKDIAEMLNYKSIDDQGIKPDDYVINEYDENRTPHEVVEISAGYLLVNISNGDDSYTGRWGARYLVKMPKGY